MDINGKLRKAQDHLGNKGWRIQLISHAPEGKPIYIGMKNPAGLVSALGLLLFLGSIVFPWSGIGGEAGAERFLQKRVQADGTCQLKVNPKNPLEAEIVVPRG